MEAQGRLQKNSYFIRLSGRHCDYCALVHRDLIDLFRSGYEKMMLARLLQVFGEFGPRLSDCQVILPKRCRDAVSFSSRRRNRNLDLEKTIADIFAVRLHEDHSLPLVPNNVIVRKSMNLQPRELFFENIAAMGRVTVSSPRILQSLEYLNKNKKYCDQIKPFNFLLTCHVRPFGHPSAINPERFHLIGPYELNSDKWAEMNWIDQYSGEVFKISADYSSRKTIRVKTYGDIIAEYEFHPEPKCADSHGNICEKDTVGLLHRRHVRIGAIIPIGKESNSLEEVDAGLIHSEESVYTIYADPSRDEWQTKIVPALNKLSISTLVRETGKSRRMIIKARKGKVRPHRPNQILLISVLRKLGVL
jgi:hypothetical protein